MRRVSTLCLLLLCLLSSTMLTACGVTGAIVGGVVVGTIVGAQAPGNEIEQIYYLGVFDPQEQVDPTVYRLTVRGQSSAISQMKFGSGWVPAPLIDGLNSWGGYEKQKLALQEANKETLAKQNELPNITTGRRLMMFGPEGFREAPANHRLVIVMGSNPEGFFRAIDESLGQIASVQIATDNSAIKSQLLDELQRLQSERKRLNDLAADVKAEMPKSTIQ